MSDEAYYEADAFKSDYFLAEVLVQRTLGVGNPERDDPCVRASIIAAFFIEVRRIRAQNLGHYQYLRSEMLGDNE